MRSSSPMKQIIPSVLGIALTASSPVYAGSAYVMVARGTEQLVRNYDPKVRDVRSIIPASPGLNTDCGKVGSGALAAFYCTNSRTIYITQKTLNTIGNNFGPEGIATVVAHEYAHARLHAIQGFTRNIIWTAMVDEIQADCVSGVYLKNATPIPLTKGMVERSANLVENVGDYLVLERDWHGTPQMRRAAFMRGYNSGKLSYCVASDSTPNKVIKKSSETLNNQINDPQSELNQLMRWGKNLLGN